MYTHSSWQSFSLLCLTIPGIQSLPAPAITLLVKHPESSVFGLQAQSQRLPAVCSPWLAVTKESITAQLCTVNVISRKPCPVCFQVGISRQVWSAWSFHSPGPKTGITSDAKQTLIEGKHAACTAPFLTAGICLRVLLF